MRPAGPPSCSASAAWALAVAELVPHLLAGSDHHALETGGATPLVDTHLALSTVTTPLLAMTQDPQLSALFSAQGLVAVRIVGTALRLGLADR